MKFKFAIISDRNKGKKIPIIEGDVTTAGDLAKLLAGEVHESDYPKGLWGDGSSITLGAPYWVKLESPDSKLPTGSHFADTPLKVMVAKEKSSGAAITKEAIENASKQAELRSLCKEFRNMGGKFLDIVPGDYTRMSNADLKEVLKEAYKQYSKGAALTKEEPKAAATSTNDDLIKQLLAGQQAMLEALTGKAAPAVKEAPVRKVEPQIAYPGQKEIEDILNRLEVVEQLFDTLHERAVILEVQNWIQNEYTEDALRTRLEELNPKPKSW